MLIPQLQKCYQSLFFFQLENVIKLQSPAIFVQRLEVEEMKQG